MEEKRIKLKIQGLASSRIQAGAYALILAEEGPRRMSVIIGMFEAQAIALALEGLTPPRPLTHDLFMYYIKATGFRVKEVFINKFNDGVFYSEIVLSDPVHEIHLDARPSDAIAIALRCDGDIFTTESVMKKCGIVIDKNAPAPESESAPLPEELTTDDMQDMAKVKKQLRLLKKKDLKAHIAKAVSEENYEFAKICKDELLRREEEQGKE